MSMSYFRRFFGNLYHPLNKNLIVIILFNMTQHIKIENYADEVNFYFCI